MTKYHYLLIPIALLFTACAGDETEAPVGVDRGRSPWAQGGGQRPDSAADIQEISVKAFEAVHRPISTYILSNTTLEPISQVTVTARVSALVQEILVEEGSRVGRGQTLVRLDDREIRNEYLQAKIAVAQAEIQAQQAEVRAEQSSANHARSVTLRRQKLISQQDFDQTALTERTDLLAFEVAQQQFEAAKARLEASELQLEYTVIEAPIAGVVTQRLIEVGDRLSVGQEVFQVENFSPIWARIFIPERDLGQVRQGQSARIRIEAFPDQEFTGRIKMINPRVDAESGTVKVTMEVNDRRGRLRPGMFGLVYIPTETRPDALVVPKKAVLRERDETRVFVIAENGTVEKRAVELGITEEDRVEVVSGLQAGDAVVTVGQESLNEGYPVKVLAWESDEGDVLVQAPPRPEASQGAGVRAPAGGPNRDGQGRPQRMRGGGDPAQRMARIKQMIESNPEWKRKYEERLKEDPELATDPQKFGEFARELFRQMRQGRGRQ